MTLLVGVLLPADTTSNRPAASTVPEGTLFPSTDDLIVYQQVGGAWVAWADYSSGGGGLSSVTDGSTTVSPASSLDFTSGAIVTDGGGGLAQVAVAGGGTVGVSQLVYRYTVTGSDKSSIDTGVDTPDAGTNDWTNGDLLEVFLTSRTDEAGLVRSSVDFIVNNDTTASAYELAYLDNVGTSVSGGGGTSTRWTVNCAAGNSAASNQVGNAAITFPNYAGTTFAKQGTGLFGVSDTSSRQMDYEVWTWKNTAAISRLKVTPNTGGTKFKVGTQLLVYKRLAS